MCLIEQRDPNRNDARLTICFFSSGFGNVVGSAQMRIVALSSETKVLADVSDEIRGCNSKKIVF